MKNDTKVQIATNLGSVLEYYEYIVFIYLIPYISIIFFSSDQSQELAFFKAVMIFASSNIAKIIGGVLLGYLSDIKGRKYVMLLGMNLMAFSGFAIGLLPSFSQIGIIAPIMLFILRFIQGIAYSAEIPVTVGFIKNYYKSNFGVKIGSLLFSVTLGSIFATLTMYLFNSLFSEEEIIDFWWRIPFLLSGLLSVIAFIIRKNNIESIDSTDNSKMKNSDFYQSLKDQKLEFFYAFLLFMLPSSLVVGYIYLPQFMEQLINHKPENLYLILSIGLISALFTALLVGKQLDKESSKFNKYFYKSFIIMFPLIWLILKESSLAFAIIYQIFLTSFMLIALFEVSKMFKNESKGFLLSTSYNLAFLTSNLLVIIARCGYHYLSFIAFPIFFTIISYMIYSKLHLRDKKNE